MRLIICVWCSNVISATMSLVAAEIWSRIEQAGQRREILPRLAHERLRIFGVERRRVGAIDLLAAACGACTSRPSDP